MACVYFMLLAVLLSIASAVGLIGSLTLLPPEDKNFYPFAIKIGTIFLILVAGAFFLFVKTGHIKISQELIKNKQEEKK